ncbi:MAG: LicD family protein [Phocaeicola sp.]|uniref:LicD family protein n=1 Tax=Phocaeicola TaxID=909656 RepID=UPI00234E6EE4|nr:LicD family protein [Phocaeicola oris]MCE2616946.1 LicD family protein [Phocaeicola oris]
MACYDIRPLQLRMLKILLAFDKICVEHDLQYCIFAGTLLGAIRHKGFIPWDDDMDVGMPRPYYEEFIKHSKEWLPAPFEFVCAENDPNYPLPFGKIQDSSTTLIERKHLSYLGGIYVDVFPYDGVPTNMLTRRMHYAAFEFYKQLLYLVYRDPYKHGHGPSSWAPLLVQKMFTKQGVQQRIRKILMKYDYNQCEYTADYTDGLRGVMQRSVYNTYARYLFEGEMVQGPKLYDEYLTKIYRDYMKLPDKEHQRQHNFYYMNLDQPYREFKYKEE